jgi:hypothetical protein
MLWIRLGLAAAMIASGEAHAAQNGHEALFASPVEKPRIVVRDLLWQCEGLRCVAPRESDSRPVIVCMAMAHDIGPVLEFSTRGVRLDAEALARCNAPREGKASVSSR